MIEKAPQALWSLSNFTERAGSLNCPGGSLIVTKAYSIGEVEVTDAAAQPSYLPAVRKAIEQAQGHTLRTLNGRVQHIEGAPPPKNVAIVEWDSLDDAVAFYKSKAWTDLAPRRDKSQKTIRRYVVEVEK
jgi:uncharacterized protein (DUF1330 family)